MCVWCVQKQEIDHFRIYIDVMDFNLGAPWCTKVKQKYQNSHKINEQQKQKNKK